MGKVGKGKKPPPSASPEPPKVKANVKSKSKNIPPKRIKCSICLDSTRRRKMKLLKCKHRFHDGCVKQWLEVNQCCPLCRAPVLSDNKKKVKNDTDDLDPPGLPDSFPLLLLYFVLSAVSSGDSDD